ncbi:hypothetical protein BM221_009210 [Beauveria bassiana]|uniref:Uncharacterized protein n=1 Tax=Beauveria bassiana TaxID=176275 RepID=A0A2N6NCM3_BEABA|nr:hypothetical protein BM221_009210 [Beauveria bassiana]
MSSSHEPAGGLHGFDDAGGDVAPGWPAPLLLRDRFTGVGSAEPLTPALRPRFLPDAAVAVCWKMLSRPPILLNFALRKRLRRPCNLHVLLALLVLILVFVIAVLGEAGLFCRLSPILVIDIDINCLWFGCSRRSSCRTGIAIVIVAPARYG